MEALGHLEDSEHHPIGYSGAVNEYRQGVRQGNYAEELLAADCRGRPGFVLDRGGAFSGQTTSAAAHAPAGRSGPELAAAAQRHDVFLKYVKYGRSQVLPDDRTAFFASTTRLAYGQAATAAAPAAAKPRIQDCLWGATKVENRNVPVSVQAYSASAERRRQLEAEAAASPYRTVEKDMIAAAARDAAACAAAKPPMAHPRDVQGEDTSVGRKPAGEFAAVFDKDYLRMGLRKP